MPFNINTLKDNDYRVNTGTRNAIDTMPRVDWNNDKREALARQKASLSKMLEMLNLNKLLMGGSSEYVYLTNSLEATIKYCDALNDTVNGTKERKDSVSYEGLAAMLNLLSVEAQDYLKYKAEDLEDLGDTDDEIAKKLTVNDVNRILSAKTIYKLATKNAAQLNATIGSEREKSLLGEKDEKGIFHAGKDNFDAQYSLLDNAEKELKATVSTLHGSSDAFKKMMTRLAGAKALLGVLREDPENQKKYEDYANSLLNFQRGINGYLKYKKDNNDFGTTSLNRIRKAGALKSAVDQIAAAQERARAEKWFDSFVRKMSEKHMDISNPATVCSVLIVDGKNKNSKINDEINDAENAFNENGTYKDLPKYIDALSGSGHMAFARVGKNGKQLMPYSGRENLANWMEREFPKSADDFTPEHKIHLFNMARKNRLFIFRNDLSYDDVKYDHITMDDKGSCLINDYYELNKGKAGFDKYEYEKNFTPEQKKLVSKASEYTEDYILLLSIMNSIKSSNKISDEEKIELQKQYENYDTNLKINRPARYFPEWFKDKAVTHIFSELARINSNTHTKTEAEEAFLNGLTCDPGVLTQESNLKLGKKFLAMIGAASFDELCSKRIIIDGNEIKPEKGYIAAAHILKAFLTKKTVQIDNKTIIYTNNKLTELKPVDPEESRLSDEYMTRLEALSKKIVRQILPAKFENSNSLDDCEQFAKWVKNAADVKEALSKTEYNETVQSAAFMTFGELATLRKTIKANQESKIPTSFSVLTDNYSYISPKKAPCISNKCLYNDSVSEAALKTMCVLIEVNDLYNCMEMKLNKQSAAEILKYRIAAQMLTNYAENVIKNTNVEGEAKLSKENKAERDIAFRLIVKHAERDSIIKELVKKVPVQIKLEPGQDPMDVEINCNLEINDDVKKYIAELDEKLKAKPKSHDADKQKEANAAVGIK